jgi:hypothetical protein
LIRSHSLSLTSCLLNIAHLPLVWEIMTHFWGLCNF